ncbi:hypothetical protein [Microbacterium soli]|uniref:Peptidylprolyl isomerase n=1 Tax=Microbacterium soli TaxID=446075 RepID=A0ABP7NGE1_9MICO
MRKTTAALSALALSALVLTGCGSAPATSDPGCARGDSRALEMAVNATGDIGSPTVNLTSPVVTSQVLHADLVAGEGPVVRTPQQNVVAVVTLLSGSTGQVLQTAPVIWSSDLMDAQLGAGGAALACAAEGSRVAFAVPAGDLPDGMAEQAGLRPDSGLVGTIDIQEVLLPHAEGRDVFNDAHGLPTVVRAADGRPGIIIPDAAAPKKAVTQTLIEGRADAVGDGTAMFQYTAVDWTDRTVTRSSWDSGVVFDGSALPEEVMDAVSAATVGSQLLVIVPGEDADATAYVVDVLGILPPELVRG